MAAHCSRAFLIGLVASVCTMFRVARAADTDDYWAGWRARQRAELAGLPGPPAPPAGGGQPVDRFLFASWAVHKMPPPGPVDDRAFARRVHLDVVGLLPTAEQLEAFANAAAPDKRRRLVESLLADRQGYAEHWMTFWNDLLRNDEQPKIAARRKPITGWLYASLRENKPLDLFVAELLNPGEDGPDGYLKGVSWSGRVSASQAPPMQAAQNVAQVFQASSIRCASCHDSFLNGWKLEAAYGLAGFFTPVNLEKHRCDRPTGERVPPRFLFPGLGEVAPDADLTERRRAVARMVTRPRNPRFAKTIVNRLWKRLLGRGLFEPVDDLDARRPNSELLEWLAHDFMSHDYDVKRTLGLILLSRVYQAPVAEGGSVGRPAPALGAGEDPVPVGPTERRLTGEQYCDAVAQVTGFWPRPDGVLKVEVANPQVRAWRHRTPDSLAAALGRPNREQVCSERPEESTVLQALELVNGGALATRLREGARALLASDLGRQEDTARVARALYLRALCRLPSDEEVALARPLLGRPTERPAARQEGWEDFLWILFMSPEFQFVR
jgi:hypothetical protein